MKKTTLALSIFAVLMTACGSADSNTEVVNDSVIVDVDSSIVADTTLAVDSSEVGSGTSDRTARIYVK
jgi:uncharacterized protein YcfL